MTSALATKRTTRPGAKAWAMMMLAEGKTIARDYASLLLPLAIPLLVLVTSATMASSEAIPGTGFTAFEIFVLPIVLAMVFGYIGLLNMPTYLSTYRKTGVLRRLGATPASPLMLLVAQVVVNAVLSLLGVGLALSVAFVFFDALAPANVPGVIAAGLLVMLSFYGLGMVIASLAPTVNSAIALGVILFLALGALGGMFGGRQALPEPLQEVSAYLPFGASSDLIAASWTGMPLELSMIVPLIITVVASIVISCAFFRWE